jgi:chromosome segregation ATPase
LRRELGRVEGDLARERENVSAARRNSDDLASRFAEAQASEKSSKTLLEAAKAEGGQLQEKLTQALRESEEQKKRSDELRKELIEAKQNPVAREPQLKTLTGDVYTKTQSGATVKLAGAKVGLYSAELFEAQETINDAVGLAFGLATKVNALNQPEMAEKIKRRNKIVAWKAAIEQNKRLIATAVADSDGRYSLAFPDTQKKYVLVAFAEREVGKSSDVFLWKKEFSANDLPKTVSLGPDTVSLVEIGFF